MATPQQRAIEIASVKVGLMAYRLASEIVQALDADRLLADAEELQRLRVRADRAEHTLGCARDLLKLALENPEFGRGMKQECIKHGPVDRFVKGITELLT